ncbi:MAG: 30S ribosomal protein S8 [Candidatus Doudnabacteria bacterium]|nr:30S ribosomal protein S8 [Candidatus Doudnabacteria bacterium]
MTDPISDMLTRIRNAYSARKAEVVVPYSKFKHSLSKVLADNGWIKNFQVKDDTKFKSLLIELKYNQEGEPALSGISRVSKPGQRIYRKNSDLPRVLGGMGTVIVSTSKGVMTDSSARKEKIGGEIICQVW